MASNPASPFGIEFRDIEDLHGARSQVGANPRTQPRSAFSERTSAANETGVAPFAALAARYGRPLRVGILSDFTRIPYANGAAFQTRFLYQELRRCGHEVTVIGPRDPGAKEEDMPPGTVILPSIPLKAYPGVQIPMPPIDEAVGQACANFDILFAQTTTLSLHFGVWLRKMYGIPLLCVNTTHLPAAYDVLVPENAKKLGWVNAGLELALTRPVERHYAQMYNDSDGLVVLSEGLRTYWRERGVTAPIHVIPRAVQPEIFDKPLGEDPYTHLERVGGASWSGSRLLCAGRHTREKSQDRVIRIFARHVAPVDREATLTMLGDGPDREFYKRVAREEGVAHRVFFPGEVPFTDMASYYGYSDVFVHASLSETYGNVMGEALWCGTPTIAFADGMGVCSQIKGGVNGVLLSPGKGRKEESDADAAFGRAVLDLLSDPQERARIGKAASKIARDRSAPLASQMRIADAFRHAMEHASACRIRAVAEGPKVLRWMSMVENFRSWGTIHGALYLVGLARPAPKDFRTKPQMHPQIAT